VRETDLDVSERLAEVDLNLSHFGEVVWHLEALQVRNNSRDLLLSPKLASQQIPQGCWERGEAETNLIAVKVDEFQLGIVGRWPMGSISLVAKCQVG
jgi:hypothetical protein